MATTPISSITPICLLCVSLLLILCPFCSSTKGSGVQGSGTKSGYLHSTYPVQVNSFLASDVCKRSSRVEERGSRLELAHKYGPCIQVNRDETVLQQRATWNMEELLAEDESRVSSIQARARSIMSASKNSSSRQGGFDEEKQMQQEAAVVPVQCYSGGTGSYLVTLRLETPRQELTLILDTSSDITGAQCEPCNRSSCYNKQQNSKFYPSNSTSFRNVSCYNMTCHLLRDSGYAEGCPSSGTCLYETLGNGDGTHSSGFLAKEKLTITPSSDMFGTFVFGRGQDNGGNNIGEVAVGLLGMGRGELSLPSQTASQYKKLFSYCFPSTPISTGYVSLGGPVSNSNTTKFTSLSPDFQNTPFYGVDITGISVGGRKLRIDKSVFSTAGAIIDSGAEITRLPGRAYSALVSAFSKMMTGYPRAAKGASSFLDTCYNFTGKETVMVPGISLFFKGKVEVEVHKLGVMVAVDDNDKILCLAFAGNGDDSDPAILGSAQQRTYEVFYDGGNGRIGFNAAQKIAGDGRRLLINAILHITINLKRDLPNKSSHQYTINGVWVWD